MVTPTFITCEFYLRKYSDNQLNNNITNTAMAEMSILLLYSFGALEQQCFSNLSMQIYFACNILILFSIFFFVNPLCPYKNLNI